MRMKNNGYLSNKTDETWDTRKKYRSRETKANITRILFPEQLFRAFLTTRGVYLQKEKTTCPVQVAS